MISHTQQQQQQHRSSQINHIETINYCCCWCCGKLANRKSHNRIDEIFRILFRSHNHHFQSFAQMIQCIRIWQTNLLPFLCIFINKLSIFFSHLNNKLLLGITFHFSSVIYFFNDFVRIQIGVFNLRYRFGCLGGRNKGCDYCTKYD